MKKIIKFLFIVIIITFLCYFIYVNYIKNNIPKLEVEAEMVDIYEYYVYGNHMNIKGNLKLDDDSYNDIKLVLYNGKEIEKNINIESNNNSISFYVSDFINDGIYLDNIDKGIYYLFLKVTYENKEAEDKYIQKYYALKNNAEYDELTYYSLSKYNNKININSDNEYNTMSLNIENNNGNNIYDVTIDPGHGGMDSGAIRGNYKESEITMNISKKIKKNLEKNGITVKITHDENDLTSNDLLDKYGEHGRAVIPNEVKSKYTFSIHANTNEYASVHGLEIYTPANVNYDFAKKMAKTIVDNTSLNYSNNKYYKVYDGIYTHNFSEKEVFNSLKEYKEDNMKPYNVTTNSNYLFMIRETGGYMTGAYVDDSNEEDVGFNPYYNSNMANESYLLEIGYLSNSSDLNILLNEQDKIAKAISNAIIEKLSN